MSSTDSTDSVSTKTTTSTTTSSSSSSSSEEEIRVSRKEHKHSSKPVVIPKTREDDGPQVKHREKKSHKKDHVEIEMEKPQKKEKKKEMYEIDDKNEIKKIETDDYFEVGVKDRRVFLENLSICKKESWDRICLCKFYGYPGTLVHIIALYLVLLGFCGGLLGAVMDVLINYINELKQWLVGLEDNQAYKIIISVLFTLVGGSCAYLTTKYVSPKGNGSGVPEMKIVLLGNHFPGFLSKRTLFAKVVGLVFAIGSGLWCGKVGPFIHISSCIAYNLAQLPLFRFIFDSQELLQQMLSVAAGCGVASNFGAPMGGLLFSIEATATYYPVRNYWYSTLAAIIASITFRISTNLHRGKTDSLFTGLLYLDYSFVRPSIIELLIAVFIGAFIAGFSTICVKNVGNLFRFRGWTAKQKVLRHNYIYIFGVMLITALVSAPWETEKNPLSNFTNPTLNELFSDKPITTYTAGRKVLPALIVCFMARYLITQITIPAPVPCGLFATNLVVGGLFGRIIGELFSEFGWTNTLGPHGAALIGASVYVSSITQTFSPTIVVMELTDNNQLLIPVFLATCVSISICRFFGVGIYDEISLAKKLPFIPDIQYSVGKNAGMIMTAPVPFVTQKTNFTLLKMLSEHYSDQNPEKLIPVVNNIDDRILIGQTTLKEIRNILNSALDEKTKSEFTFDCKECPIVAMKSSELSEVHMLIIASHAKTCFVVHRGRLEGEITIERLTEEFKSEVIVVV